MKSTEIKIEGMSCGHCVMAVKKALSNLNEIKVEEIQIGKVVLKFEEGTDALSKAIDAIQDAGYTVVN